MSLVTIAVISCSNYPLYLRDFVLDEESSQNRHGFSTTRRPNNNNNNVSSNNYTNDDGLMKEEKEKEKEEGEDPFGFFESQKSNPNDSSSLKNQVSQDFKPLIMMMMCVFVCFDADSQLLPSFGCDSIHHIIFTLFENITDDFHS